MDNENLSTRSCEIIPGVVKSTGATAKSCNIFVEGLSKKPFLSIIYLILA
ncbi:Uncharacterised protein [Chlamydia abortus]|nr:Uncharacterised protein [Chlamydia abortus]